MSPLADMRDRFEAWYTGGRYGCPSVERSTTDPNGYKLMQAQSAWTVWVAAQERMDAALRAYVAFAAERRAELGSLSPEMEAVDAQARAALWNAS